MIEISATESPQQEEITKTFLINPKNVLYVVKNATNTGNFLNIQFVNVATKFYFKNIEDLELIYKYLKNFAE